MGDGINKAARGPRSAVAFVALALVAGVLSGVAGPAPSPAFAAGNRYVALGDSYTAGPLIPDQTGQPLGCLRSNQNYPRLVAQALALSLTDVSCSGADTADMTASQGVTPGPNPPQFDALTADTDIVTLGIGGNDIGFSSLVTDCVALLPISAPVCQPDYVRDGIDEISIRIAATAPKVAAVIQGIRARSPIARIYVVGYPAILPESGGGCWPSLPLSNGDLPWLRAKNKELNTMLATQAVANGARYVDAYTPGIGHDACQGSGTRWVEGIIPQALQAAPVHPNARGMAGVAAVVAARITATPNLPSAPLALTATPGDRQVALAWSAPADDGGGAISAYRVFRNGALVHTTPNGATRTFVDTGRTNGVQYGYTVRAVNAAGPGAASTTASATPLGLPGAPTGLAATATSGEVALSWTAPAVDGGTPVTGYRLYRDGAALPATLGATDTGFVDDDVVNGQQYRYQVAARNIVGEGARSAEVTATPTAGFTCCPANPFSDVPADLDPAVDWAAYFAVVAGPPGATLRPDAPLKRKQVVAMLWHLMDEPVAPAHVSYADVAPSAPYAPALDWATAQGLVTPFGDGTFRPRDPVTRSQLVAMMWRAVGAPTGSDPHGYTDTRTGAYYQPGLDWAVDHGLVVPAGGRRFRPKDPVNRGATVTWLYNLAWTADAWSAAPDLPDAVLF